jgi:septal ring factor EnvC (AmiA/AmiB activator)
VRGTPQQIIEKYNQLHRDAQLSGDRVNAENFAQHAEHYTRLLAEAQREVDQRREEIEAQNRERQAERDKERNDRVQAQEQAGNDQPVVDRPDPRSSDDEREQSSDSGLVETPEEKPQQRSRKPRAPRKPRPDQRDTDSSPEAAE